MVPPPFLFSKLWKGLRRFVRYRHQGVSARISITADHRSTSVLAIEKGGALYSPRGWTRHIGNALRHRRTGRELVFHGPDAMRDRDEFLRRLNGVKPRPIS
jgi:hypothetical protein